METTKLSSKGQVIIPKALRAAYNWEAGLELVVTEVDGGILLRAKGPFEQTTLEDVAGCMAYQGKSKSQEDIDAAMKKAARTAWRAGS